jgi:hypothetical protein
MSDLLNLLRLATSSGPFGPDGWSADPTNRTTPAQRCLPWFRLGPDGHELVLAIAEGRQNFALTCERAEDGWLVHLWAHHRPRGFILRSVLLPARMPTEPAPDMSAGALYVLANAGLALLALLGAAAWFLAA